MGNAVAVQCVAESARRRLLLQQHNARPDVLVSRAVSLALQRRRADAGGSGHSPSSSLTDTLPLHAIFDVLCSEFGVCCSLEDLPRALEQLGCRLERHKDTDVAVDEPWYSVAALVAFLAPRRVLRQVARPAHPTKGEQEFVRSGLSVWQASKGGDVAVLSEICARHPTAFRALDAFDNTPLYYASLCGREEAVSLLMALYDRSEVEIPADELLRCVTNALNARTRGLLQRKLALEEALALKKKEEEEEAAVKGDEEGDEGGFFLGLEEQDEQY